MKTQLIKGSEIRPGHTIMNHDGKEFEVTATKAIGQWALAINFKTHAPYIISTWQVFEVKA